MAEAADQRLCRYVVLMVVLAGAAAKRGALFPAGRTCMG